MRDEGGARDSDPLPSHDAGKRTLVLKDRVETWACLLKLLDDPDFPAWQITRKTTRADLNAHGLKDDTSHDTGRRRVSDFMEQVWYEQYQQWRPLVGFGLCQPVLKANGKPLKFEGAGVIELTAKGLDWKNNPSKVDWHWKGKTLQDLEDWEPL